MIDPGTNGSMYHQEGADYEMTDAALYCKSPRYISSRARPAVVNVTRCNFPDRQRGHTVNGYNPSAKETNAN